MLNTPHCRAGGWAYFLKAWKVIQNSLKLILVLPTGIEPSTQNLNIVDTSYINKKTFHWFLFRTSRTKVFSARKASSLSFGISRQPYIQPRSAQFKILYPYRFLSSRNCKWRSVNKRTIKQDSWKTFNFIFTQTTKSSNSSKFKVNVC